MRARATLALVGLGLVLAGCAVQPIARPSDFPFHADQPPFTLHWRVDQEPGRVTTAGVVEVAVGNRVMDLTVELQGLDQGGQVVSRGRGFTHARSFTGTDPWPFSASLRPTGQEARYTVVVAEVTWQLMRGGGR
jgi:hypothetical protein